MAWSHLEPRSHFNSFSFSPTTISILAWGPAGVQLLDNHTRVPLPDKTASNYDHGDHLVAYSKDRTRVATARRGDNVAKVLDPLSDTPQRSIDTPMRILDIGIVGNTIFAASTCGLVGWDLEVEEVVYRAFSALVAEIAIMDTDPEIAEQFTLSTDCSWIAFTLNGTIFLYDIHDQRILYKSKMLCNVVDIRFAPHGHQLYVIPERNWFKEVGVQDVMSLRTVGQWRIVDVPEEFTEGAWSWDGPFPLYGCSIQCGSGWIEDCGGRKLLWLPPNWRMTRCFDTKWGGNFLAFVGGHHPAPIIIAFQPQLLLPPSHSVQSSDAWCLIQS